MKSNTSIPEPSPEVFDFIDGLELTAEQDHAWVDAMVFYHYRVGWTGDPMSQPIHVALERMIEVGISVPPCVMAYVEKVREAKGEPRG